MENTKSNSSSYDDFIEIPETSVLSRNHTNNSRRQSDLRAYMILWGAEVSPQHSPEHHVQVIDARPRTHSSPVTPTSVPVDPKIQKENIRYGLLNAFRTPSTTAAQRSSEEIHTLRLNMINLYLKYIIQTILYSLAAYLLWVILSACFQMPIYVLIPLVLVFALHLAARRMHHPDHALQENKGYTLHSLTGPYDAMSNACILIDKAANYSVGFFSGFANRLANSTLLDNQITYVPKNGFSG